LKVDTRQYFLGGKIPQSVFAAAGFKRLRRSKLSSS
jgi:hypothetical protein